MSRQARVKSKTGIYHVMLRGINRNDIFHDEDDNLFFLQNLEIYKQQQKIKVHGWCMMNNHAHLLLQEDDEEISQVMKRLEVSYAWYYRTKYHTVGHLFQDRFRSENVEDDTYLKTVIRYIHQNPVKAGVAQM